MKERMSFDADQMYREIASYEAMRSMAADLHENEWTVEEYKAEHDLPAEWIERIEADGSALNEDEVAELKMFAEYMYKRLAELNA